MNFPLAMRGIGDFAIWGLAVATSAAQVIKKATSQRAGKNRR
jgi:hypothetical protein